MIAFVLAIAAIGVILLFLPKFHRQWRLWRWRNSLSLNKKKQFFKELFQDVNGFQLSKQARRKNDEMALTYGEIQFESFVALLCQIELNANSIFCDLGSGTGKAIIACSLVFDIKKCIGIELLTPLHEAAMQVKNKLNQIDGIKAHKIEYINADFMENMPEDITIVFINASAFFGEMWQKIVERLERLPHLQHIITTKPIESHTFEVCHHSLITMSWGLVDATIYRKKA